MVPLALVWKQLTATAMTATDLLTDVLGGEAVRSDKLPGGLSRLVKRLTGQWLLLSLDRRKILSSPVRIAQINK
jgi:hypothetical protein